MTTTSISVRMDAETKRKGEELFKISFIVGDPKPNTESLQAIQEAEEFFKSGRQERFTKAEELFDELGI